MIVKRFAAVAAVLIAAGCSSPAPYTTTTGLLQPGATMTIEAANTELNVYKPAVGEPPNRFTVSATVSANSTPPPPPTIRSAGNGVVINAPGALSQLLVRVPDKVNLVVDSRNGAVNVTDITGNIDVSAGNGDVHVMAPGYAQASTQNGHLAVTFGATEWPGTLKFSSGNGDMEISIPETAKFRVHMHTDDGTLFDDFGLKGTSQGNSETIDGSVNGGGSQRVDIEAKHGTIRLLRLAPQA